MRVVDQHVAGAGVARAVDRGAHFERHQLAVVGILGRVRTGRLASTSDRGRPFHVGRDVELHCAPKLCSAVLRVGDLGVVRRYGDKRLERVDGLRAASDRARDDALVKERRREVRLFGEHVVQLRERLEVVAGSVQGGRIIGAGVGIGRIQRERARVIRDRLIELPGIEIQRCQADERARGRSDFSPSAL